MIHRGGDETTMLRSIQVAVSASVFAMMPMLGEGPAAEERDREDSRRAKPSRLAPNAANPTGTFELGELSAVLSEIAIAGGRSWDGRYRSALSESVVTAKDVYTFNKNTLDDALTVVPGVSAANTGGSRNERLVFVRGFDRFQVPLSIDGIRVYLPADNRLDFGRFLTPDLAEIQVQKGFVSVLNGPGGMGGAINLVTRKPTREAEAEFRTGVDVGNRGALSAFNGFGVVGTRQENYYLQASGTVRDSDGWFLSQGFRPIPIGGGPAIEDGGRRDFSAVSDYRVNLKAGITPNATDEYSLSYTKQAGVKGAPYSTFEPVRGITPTPLPRARPTSGTGAGRIGTSTASTSCRAPRSATIRICCRGLTTTPSTTCFRPSTTRRFRASASPARSTASTTTTPMAAVWSSAPT